MKLYLGSLLLAGLFTAGSQALPLVYTPADERLVAPIAATLPARRLAQLEDSNGYAFWSRRLRRDGQKALESLGFYHATIKVELDGQQHVQVAIDTGMPTRVGSVVLDLVGFPGDGPPLPLGLERDDHFDHRVYESGKRKLHSWLLANGYLNATLTTHRVEVNRKSHTADIILRWDVGPRYRFGQTLFLDTTLSSQFLQRYVQHQEGSALTEAELQKFSQILRTSGYFNSVEIAPRIDRANPEWLVPVEVRLTPVARSLYEAGFSIGTDRGPGVDAGVTRRQANALGHRWELRADVSARRQFVAGRYEMPAAAHLDRTRLLDFNVVSEDTDSTRRTTTRTALSLQKNWHRWRRTDAINVLNERYTVAGDKLESTLLIGSVELFRREANDVISPTKGWRTRGVLSASTRLLGSSTDLLRAEINAKVIGSFGTGNRWIARARAGSLWSDDFAEVPSSLRFFSGGDYSVRGFDYQALGPRDAADAVVGGVHVAELSLEVDHLITPKWRIALFSDAGNAFGDGRESLEYAMGLGIRWLSPVGPLRLDIASPLSDPDSSVRIHFSAGPDL